MTICEKCWSDAKTRAYTNGTDIVVEYEKLLSEKTFKDLEKARKEIAEWEQPDVSGETK